ncbi:MAG: ribonuclease III [Clostridia bacterium]
MNKNFKYKFKDESLFYTAMTHSSHANEQKNIPSNERLEFLGDAILGVVCADYLYKKHGEMPEGELTKHRAAIVCEKSLYEVGIDFGIEQSIILGKGEEANGGRTRHSIIADAVEALLAAIYIDGGMSAATDFAMSFIPTREALSLKGKSFKDYKTILQEIVQKNREETLAYKLVHEEGPDHNKVFTVEILLNSNVFAQGVGKSKKEAEQMAAKAALELMGQ